MEITDEDFATLRTKLGLGDDAEIGDVLDALDEQKPPEEGGTGEPEAAPAAAKLPDGVEMVDSGTWAQVQADAKLGREARTEQVEARRTAAVTAAIAAGKIVPARKEHWLTLMKHDEEGTTAVLQGLKPMFGTAELGYDGGEDSGGTITSLDEVRKTPAYQAWVEGRF